MKELEQALRIADRVLDEPYRDPDDDISVLARQLTRACNPALTPHDYPDFAVRFVAQACYAAQWEEPWPCEGTIDHALAMQIGRAALDAMQTLTTWYAYAKAAP